MSGPDVTLSKSPRQAAPRRIERLPPERLRLLAHRIHRLGERPLFELFSELDATPEIRAPLHDRLERYAQLAPLADFIAALDGDRLLPLRFVRARR
jgi:hypothetical protein